MNKILIIQTAFIGDVILATSLAENLHSSFPDAQIDFLLRKGNEGLLKQHPFIHEVIVWDKKNKKYKNLFRLLRIIRKRKYDLVVNCQRFAASGLLTAFSKSKHKVGFRKNPFSFLFTKKVDHIIKSDSKSVHETERNHALISEFCDNDVAKPRLYTSADDDAFVQSYKNKKYICMAPASVWYTKQLPAEKWIQLIRLFDKRFQIYLIGSKQDETLCDSIKNELTDYSIENLCGKTNLLQTASLMRDATMNYVNDSAPLHVASAMNAPSTAFFCSTLPAFGFGPLSDLSTLAEIKTPLSCRPCGLHGKKACPENHFRCAFEIDLSPIIISYG